MPRVTIGSNVVIGAGSIVVKDIPDYSVAVGNPCKVIRSNTDDDNYTCLTDKHLYIYSENMCLWNRCIDNTLNHLLYCITQKRALSSSFTLNSYLQLFSIT